MKQRRNITDNNLFGRLRVKGRCVIEGWWVYKEYYGITDLVGEPESVAWVNC